MKTTVKFRPDIAFLVATWVVALVYLTIVVRIYSDDPFPEWRNWNLISLFDIGWVLILISVHLCSSIFFSFRLFRSSGLLILNLIGVISGLLLAWFYGFIFGEMIAGV